MWLILESWTNTQKKMWAARMGEKVYHIKGNCYHGCRSRLAGGMQRKQCYLNRTTKQNRRKQILSLLWRIDTTQTLITPLVFLAQCKQKSSGSNQLLWRSTYWTSPLPTTFAHLMEISSCKRKKKKSYLQTLSELKQKEHIPQWLRSVLPWSLVWHAPQPAPLVAGAINEDQKQNKIIGFLNY